MKCPKCRSEMERVTIGRTDVDRCVSCKGLWFDMSEDQDLLKFAKEIDIGDDDAKEKTVPGRRIYCPVCAGTPMVRMADPRHPHIWFESCPSCQGCYLDAGEFRDMGEHSFAEALTNFFTRER